MYVGEDNGAPSYSKYSNLTYASSELLYVIRQTFSDTSCTVQTTNTRYEISTTCDSTSSDTTSLRYGFTEEFPVFAADGVLKRCDLIDAWSGVEFVLFNCFLFLDLQNLY